MMATGKKSKSTPKGGGNNKKAQDSQKSFPVFAIVVAAIVALGILLLIVTRSNTKDEPFNIDAQVSVTGAPLPGFPTDKSPDSAIGMQAPQASGVSLDGTPISISQDGKPKAIIFLAHWCPHCQKEVPVVQKWINQNGMPDGVEVIAVATGNDEGKPNYPPNNWLRREGWTVPTLIDSKKEEVARAFGLSGYPFWAVLDSQGKVVLRQSGEISAEQLPQLFAIARQSAPSAPIADPNLSSQVPGGQAPS